MNEKLGYTIGEPLTTKDDLVHTRGLVTAASLAIDPSIGERIAAGATDVLFQTWVDAGVPMPDILAHVNRIPDPEASRIRPTLSMVNVVSTALEVVRGRTPRVGVRELLNRGERVVFQPQKKNIS